MKTYSQLIKLKTYDERLDYLMLRDRVDYKSPRHVANSELWYKDKIWRQVREFVIKRDFACDLGIEDMDIVGNIYVHHINPMETTNKDIYFLDPENLITVSLNTHNIIHYGQRKEIEERKPGDTKLW